MTRGNRTAIATMVAAVLVAMAAVVMTGERTATFAHPATWTTWEWAGVGFSVAMVAGMSMIMGGQSGERQITGAIIANLGLIGLMICVLSQ